MIVLTVIIHVLGLLVIKEKAQSIENRLVEGYRYPVVFAVIIGSTALSALPAWGRSYDWAVAYRVVGALPDNSSAILYSLSAMTAYGHASLDLATHWQVMGALEALNGMLLFGLTTAPVQHHPEGLGSQRIGIAPDVTHCSICEGH